MRVLQLGALSTNCYLIGNKESDEIVIIDPADEFSVIKETILRIRKKPAAVLLTHGHFDHIGAANELREYYHIPVLAYVDEEKVLLDQYLNLSSMMGGRISIKADRFVHDCDLISYAGLTFQVIHTPGHTKGSCCYYCKEEKLLVSGDTLFAESYGRTDFPTGSSKDLLSSIVGRLFLLEDDVCVLPGHGHSTTISHEKKHNPCAYYYKENI